MGYESDIAALSVRFAARLPDRAETIAATADAAMAGQPGSALDPLRIALHSLAGSAPTLGFDEIGALSRTAEETVLIHLRAESALTPAALVEIHAAIAPVVARCRAGGR